jgi:TolB-like protein
MTLDQALLEAANSIDERLTRGSRIAMLNFNSPAEQFSAYVLDELSANLVGSRHLLVIDRQEIDLRRGELNLQLSGEVSDDSMQLLGRTLGAQSVVTGNVRQIDNGLRMMIRVLNVESGAVEVQYREDIANDRRVAALMAGSVTQTAAAGQATGRQAAAQPAGPADGTYTFWPRPRATQGGRPVDAYLDKATVSGGYVTFYLSNVPVGASFQPVGFMSGFRAITLENLDNQGRPPLTIADWGGYNHGTFLTFKNVTGTRFRLTNPSVSPHAIFNEIILSTPD